MVKHRWGALWLFLLWLTQPQLFAGPGRVTHPEPIGKWLQVLESPQGARCCVVFFQLSDMKPSEFSRCFFLFADLSWQYFVFSLPAVESS